MSAAFSVPVTGITLPQAVFHEAEFVPAQVNLFCGRNGTGKSTAAGCFRSGSLQFAEPDRRPVISIFDTGYVQQNIRQHAHLDGIVTVCREDAEITAQIAEARRQRLLAEAELRCVRTEAAPMKAAADAACAEYEKTVWQKSQSLRARYPLAVRGGNSSRRFAKALRFSGPYRFERSYLDRMYRAAFGDAVRLFPQVPVLADIDTLDRLAEDPALDAPLYSSGDSQFQAFLAAVGNAEWVRQGHEAYSAQAGDRCPFCQQPLPADFSDRLSACFDSAYRQGIARIAALEQEYRQAANAAYMPLQRILARRCPSVNYRSLETDAELLRSLLRENLSAIRGKLRTPAEPAVLTGVRELLQRINCKIDGINAGIARNNAFITDRAAMQEKCTGCVMSHLAFLLADETEHLQKEISRRASDLPDLERRAEQLREKISRCTAEIARLSDTVSDTAQAAEQINTLLHDAGFTGFGLRQSKRYPRAYTVIRQNGETAAALSEGEQRLLAFLYFCVSAQTPAQNGRVLVLDDPYTALDSETAAVVQRLTRELCGQCAAQSRTGIRQVFVMTCRPQYYRELQLDLPENGIAVTLQKTNGKTSLIFDAAPPDAAR